MGKFDKETEDKMKEVNAAYIFFQRVAKHKRTLIVSKEFYDKYKAIVEKK